MIVPGASHLFSEPDALGKVARLARDWFVHYLTPRQTVPTAANLPE
jgi:putative phosphoribosyl transferase